MFVLVGARTCTPLTQDTERHTSAALALASENVPARATPGTAPAATPAAAGGRVLQRVLLTRGALEG